MATTTTTTRRVATSLEALSLMLGDLPEVAQEWPQMGKAERASWSLDWDQVIGTHLQVLDQHYHAGAMTLHQQAEYNETRRRLGELLPIVRQLGLFEPLD